MPITETIQEFAFEGSPTAAITVGCSLLALTCWFASRELRHLAFRKVATLLLLRLVALLVLVWMLADPSTRITTRETKLPTIALLVDSSSSMSFVDPPDRSGNAARWTSTAPRELAPLNQLDRLIGDFEGIRAALEAEDSLGVPAPLRAGLANATRELASLSAEIAPAQPPLGAHLRQAAEALSTGSLPDLKELLPTAIEQLRRGSDTLGADSESITSQLPDALDRRRDKVDKWLKQAENSWLAALSKQANVLRYTFASDAQPVPAYGLASLEDSAPGSATTDLRAALRRAALDSAQQNAAAVVLITDGGHNAAGDPREDAGALNGAPLYILPIGTTKAPRDVLLHHANAPRAIIKVDHAHIEALITAYSCEGSELKVELLENGRALQTQTHSVESDFFDQRVAFRWKGSELGRHKLTVRVTPIANEFSEENNALEVELDVMSDTIRVLAADQVPRWEFRYLVNLLQRDKHVELYSLLFDEGLVGAKEEPRAGFPKDLAGWRKFQVVVLGDIEPAHLTPPQQELLREYVSSGGNLIVIAGGGAMPHAYLNQPIASLLPVLPAVEAPDPRVGLRLALTSEGASTVATQVADDWLKSKAIWERMSEKLPIYNLSPVSRPKPAARVLISASRPSDTNAASFLSWQYAGLGRVVYLAAPVTHQLRYRAGDEFHHRFWGQLLRWTISRGLGEGSRTVRISTDKAHYEAGERAEILVRLSKLNGEPAGGVPTMVEASQNAVTHTIPLREQPNAPGEFRGVLNDLSAGPLRLQPKGAMVNSLLASEGRRDPVELSVMVTPNAPSEMRNPLCNLALLTELANAGRGAILAPAAVPNALRHLDLRADVRERVAREPLWNRWSLLILFLLALTVEWVARKEWGMV